MPTSGAADEEGVATEHPSHTDRAPVDGASEPTNLTKVDKASAPKPSTPLFRLPRELRDEVYNLVIPSEIEIHYVLTLEPGKRPQTTIFAATHGVAHTCHQLRDEYSAAVEPYVKKLVQGQYIGRAELSGPGPDNEYLVLEIPQFEITRAPRVELDAEIERTQQIQAIKIDVPVRERGHTSRKLTTLILSFSFAGFKEDDCHERFDILWKKESNTLDIPASLAPSLAQIIETARAVDWKGSLREKLLWQTYFVRHAKRAESEAMAEV